MRLPTGPYRGKLGTAGCILLPIALFSALMLATAGTAIWPRIAAPGAAILCGGGEVVYESHGATYRPSEYIVTRQIYCRTGTGKDAPRGEITLQAIGVSFLVYAAGLFLLLQFVVRPLLAGRLRRRLQALGLGGTPPAGRAGVPAAPAGLDDILARVSEAMRRGEADVEVRNVTLDMTGTGNDVETRLATLKALRDRGLITAADYEAKKAEILAGL